MWWKVQDENLACSVEEREAVLLSSLAFLNENFLKEDDENRLTTVGIVSLVVHFEKNYFLCKD